MELYVKTLTGKTITIRAYSNDTIYDVQCKIEAMVGQPTDQQRLIFAGKQLESNLAITPHKMEQVT